jgi:hypothetical protein
MLLQLFQIVESNDLSWVTKKAAFLLEASTTLLWTSALYTILIETVKGKWLILHACHYLFSFDYVKILEPYG